MLIKCHCGSYLLCEQAIKNHHCWPTPEPKEDGTCCECAKNGDVMVTPSGWKWGKYKCIQRKYCLYHDSPNTENKEEYNDCNGLSLSCCPYHGGYDSVKEHCNCLRKSIHDDKVETWYKLPNEIRASYKGGYNEYFMWQLSTNIMCNCGVNHPNYEHPN